MVLIDKIDMMLTKQTGHVDALYNRCKCIDSKFVICFKYVLAYLCSYSSILRSVKML